MTNLFSTLCTKLYQNRSGFVEDMTKTFSCAFSVHLLTYIRVSVSLHSK